MCSALPAWSQAFIATSVPDTLCSLEAWHILWGFDRYFCSRIFSPLKLDDAMTLRFIDPEKKVVGSDSETEPEDADGGYVPELKDADGGGVPMSEAVDGGYVPKSKRPKLDNLTRKKPVEKYMDRLLLERGSLQLTDEYLLNCSFFRFYSEVEDKNGKLYSRKMKPRVLNLKPFLNLDMAQPSGPRMAKMCLRAFKPFSSPAEDPCNLNDDEALTMLQEFVSGKVCPSFVRRRYQYHNRVRQKKVAAMPSSDNKCQAPAKGPAKHDDDSLDELAQQLVRAQSSRAQKSFEEIAHLHNIRWHDEECAGLKDQPLSVHDVLSKVPKRNLPPMAVKQIYSRLSTSFADSDHASDLLSGMALQLAVVSRILDIDLEPYQKVSKGVRKQILSSENLKRAAKIWSQIFNDRKIKALLSDRHPYARLWNNFKRHFLSCCGLEVPLQSVKHWRIYFKDGRTKPLQMEHASEESGEWRMAVFVRQPYRAYPEDGQNEETGFIPNAAAEMSCGPAGLPQYEVRLRGDDYALDCPDSVTTAEWDALWPYEERICNKTVSAVDVGVLAPDDPRLLWFLPESQNGISDAAFRVLQGTEVFNCEKKFEDLDPTQQLFVRLGIQWYENRENRDNPQFLAVLLGTAGTGKTTTMQVLIQRLRNMGMKNYKVAAFTGVAASNIGMGARTLHDIFKLHKTIDTSGEIAPLSADELQELATDLEDVELVLIDEISMLSKVMLAQVNMRLREWRKHLADEDNMAKPFGGLAVILAGDFGQLPPIAISPSLSLLHDRFLSIQIREGRTANLGLRLFNGFKVVIRLRRIHRQPGASEYKESLLRLRDGAMSKEDHELWRSHDLANFAYCELTPARRSVYPSKKNHHCVSASPHCVLQLAIERSCIFFQRYEILC
jgi:hypothetical protein